MTQSGGQFKVDAMNIEFHHVHAVKEKNVTNGKYIYIITILIHVLRYSLDHFGHPPLWEYMTATKEEMNGKINFITLWQFKPP